MQCYTCCPLSLCLGAVCNVSVPTFLLSSSLLWSSLGSHPCKTDSLTQVKGALTQYMVVHLPLALPAELGKVAVCPPQIHGSWGNVSWGLPHPHPSESGGHSLMRIGEYPQISASCGLDVLPFPLLLLADIRSCSPAHLHLRIFLGSNQAAWFYLVVQDYQKAFRTDSDLLCGYKRCCFSISPSGDRAQN